MAAITKAELARRFGVDRAQATRWADHGMPVLPGGMVDAEVAARWVDRNIDSTVRHARQRQVHGHVAPAAREQADAMDQLMRLAIYWTAQRIPGLVAMLAVEGGLSVDLAREMHDRALVRSAELAEEVRDGMLNLPPGGMGPLRKVTPFPPVDWEALAAGCNTRRLP